MRKLPAYFSFFFLFGLISGPVQAQSPEVTFQRLLNEMVNRAQIARYPEPYYTTRQFSSYDRSAQSPGDSTWFANWDRSQFIRVEQSNDHKEYVMLDTEGPGAVVRFWMTFAGEGAGEGTLRIYFDHEEKPTIEGNVLDIISGGSLVGKPLSSSVSPQTEYRFRGQNLYLPLPFGTHCKITYESTQIKGRGAKHGGENVYYNINYRDYEKGTAVHTFDKNQLQKNASLLKEVQQKLGSRDKEAALREMNLESDSFKKTIGSGETFSYKLNGPAAIRKLAVNLEAEDEKQALRSTVMRIRFDSDQTVWVPVGDFFGTGYQYRDSDTWYTTVTGQGKMSVYWVMPFQSKAEITLRNLGNQSVKVDAKFEKSEWNWDERSMHFGASWHQYTDLQTGGSKNMVGGGSPFDINFTHLQGQGVYVGDVLTLFNTAYSWWGEGDEKVYIDGESFPSHFGTGTEDYYGYAWARPESFTNHPFISQPDGSGNITPGYTINQRFRVLDALPFKNELEFDMEMWHWANTVIDYAPTSFFYLKPGGEILVDHDIKNAKESVTLKRSDIISPRLENGRIEGENMIIEKTTGGALQFQHLDNILSNGKHLWWRSAETGDSLVVKFRAPNAGKFSAKAKFVTASDYGTVDILLNGEPILQSFDGYNDSLSTKIVNLGEIHLHKGENQIIIKALGKSPKADHILFGLDYLSIEE